MPEHLVSLVRSAANTAIDNTGDESVTVEITIENAARHIRSYGLLNKVSFATTKKWGDLNEQIFEIRLNFRENKMSLNVGGRLADDANFQSFIEYAENQRIRSEYKTLFDKNRNRANAALRARPYFRKVLRGSGGIKVLSKDIDFWEQYKQSLWGPDGLPGEK